MDKLGPSELFDFLEDFVLYGDFGLEAVFNPLREGQLDRIPKGSMSERNRMKLIAWAKSQTTQ
jgi:hypothetical protein